MIGMLAANLKVGGLLLVAAEWQDVHSLAEQLSVKHTISGGNRPMDLLHVATAMHLRLSQFLSFDENQKKLAKAEGLRLAV